MIPIVYFSKIIFKILSLSAKEQIIRFGLSWIILFLEIIPSEVDAKMNQGVLEVVAPKKETKPEQKMRRIELK